jgi:hypothetical protein
LTPTRELAYQISEQFEALGAQIGIKCAVIVGGMDMMTQSIALAKKPVNNTFISMNYSLLKLLFNFISKAYYYCYTWSSC